MNNFKVIFYFTFRIFPKKAVYFLRDSGIIGCYQSKTKND